jgi:hypothetical protein
MSRPLAGSLSPSSIAYVVVLQAFVMYFCIQAKRENNQMSIEIQNPLSSHDIAEPPVAATVIVAVIVIISTRIRKRPSHAAITQQQQQQRHDPKHCFFKGALSSVALIKWNHRVSSCHGHIAGCATSKISSSASRGCSTSMEIDASPSRRRRVKRGDGERERDLYHFTVDAGNAPPRQ